MIPATALALLASLAYGSRDFVAGLVSRRVSSVAVALWSQLAGAATLSVALAVGRGGWCRSRCCPRCASVRSSYSWIWAPRPPGVQGGR
ncbi:MAG: hypothetical protein ACRDTR_05020, partial [Rubrobacter sp.]